MFGAAITSHATWAVVVRSLDTGERLFELNPDKLMMPASNMKVVTLAGAAGVLTWDYRFVTTLETSAPVEAGVLRGDLVVRGSGDPTINTRNGRGAAVFAEWIAALKAAGITRIDGRIVGDDQAFDDEGLGGGWAWDDLQYGYAAPVRLTTACSTATSWWSALAIRVSASPMACRRACSTTGPSS